MKRTTLLIAGCLATAASFAQTKPAAKPATKPGAAKPAAKPAAAAVPMKNATDSFSYAIGLSIANFYKQSGITNINNQMVIKALNDSKSGKPALTEEQSNACIMGVMQTARSAKASGAKKAGETYLAQNKSKAGVITLPSGLQYQVLKEGNGPKPTINDQVKCHYIGSFIDGKEFESSYKNGQPVTFPVGGVIRGWTEALQLMPIGSKWKLFIPSDLGYGDMDNGPIAGGSTLIFEVELIEVVKADQPATQPATGGQ